MDPLKQTPNTGFFLGDLFPSGGSPSEVSNEIEANVKKRNRISFVCQACRKSKTKCDREKPRCGRCIQHGIACVYDVERQRAPKNPSKDAKIARLEKEVDYWRRKAMTSMQAEVRPTMQALPEEKGQEGREDEEDIPGAPPLKASRPSTSSNYNDGADEVLINLYKSHPSMIRNGACKREVKPLSENYVITQDMYLSGLLTSIFADKHTTIPGLSTNASVSRLKDVLMGQGRPSSQVRKLDELTDNTADNGGPNNAAMAKVGFLLQSVFERHYLEDFCPRHGEYSDILKSFIKEMEDILPPYDVIQEYKVHFYRSVYPSVSFLDEKTFEDALQSTLFPDQLDPSKVVIRLGNSRLRHKLENLCILLLVLKLSYVSLQVVGKGSQILTFEQKENLERYPIGNDAIMLVQKVLAAENFFSRANENIIACLLYIWAFFVYSPEESDFFQEQPTDLIIGLAMMLAMSIGLHRDPSDFPHFRDSSLVDRSILNYRRKLWIATVTCVCAETSLKGRLPHSSSDLMRLFINIRAPNTLQVYMQKVTRDACGPPSPQYLQNHENCFKRAQLALLILDLHKLTLTYNRSFTLGAIEELRAKIVKFLDENFPMQDFPTDPENGYHEFERYINSTALHMRIIGRLMILRSSMAIFLHLESLLTEGSKLLPYYRQYFNQICLDALSLITHFRAFFISTRKFKALPLGSFNIAKYIQLALPSTLLAVLAILMRIDLACNMLSQSENRSSGSTSIPSEKLDMMILLKNLLESILEDVHKAASEHLRFSYFSVFKTLSLFDVIIAKIRKNELWTCVMKLQKLCEVDKPFLKSLNTNLSFLCLDPNNQESIVEKLKQKNYVTSFSSGELDAVYNGIKTIYTRLPQISTPWANESSPKVPLRTLFQTFEDNDNNAGFDRTASLAALDQNINLTAPPDEKIKTTNQEVVQDGTSNVVVSEEGGPTIAEEFPGSFGGLDIFDFLFGNEP